MGGSVPARGLHNSSVLGPKRLHHQAPHIYRNLLEDALFPPILCRCSFCACYRHSEWYTAAMRRSLSRALAVHKPRRRVMRRVAALHVLVSKNESFRRVDWVITLLVAW